MGDFDRALNDAMKFLNAEHAEGYQDGRNTDTPEASSNRSEAYRHSFEVGRAERANKPIPAMQSRLRADSIRANEVTRRLQMLLPS